MATRQGPRRRQRGEIFELPGGSLLSGTPARAPVGCAMQLRRYSATELISGGVDIRTAAGRLGRSDRRGVDSPNLDGRVPGPCADRTYRQP